MVNRGELRVYEHQEQSMPNLYYLPGVKSPGLSPGALNAVYGHEMDCANLFVSLYKTGQLVRWERYWDEEQRKELGERFNVWPDRIFELQDSDQVFFLEVDRGSEDPTKQIVPKLERYIRLSNFLTWKQPFTVLFTAQGYRLKKDDRDSIRMKELIPFLKAVKRGQQFIIGLHSEVLSDPLGKTFTDPTTGNKLSVLDLDALSILRHGQH